MLTAATLSVNLLSGGSTTIRLFDVCGRVVWSTNLGLQTAGYHEISIEISDPGVYFCRMTSGDFTETQSFVVIE